MQDKIRTLSDKVFTVVCYLSVILLVLILGGVLLPMISRGASAVYFKGTVEFRKLQQYKFNRGNDEALQQEIQRIQQARKPIYEQIDSFKRGMDPDILSSRTTDIYREYGRKLQFQDVERSTYKQLRRATRAMRDQLEEAFESNELERIIENCQAVLAFQDDERFKNTIIQEYFTIAADYLQNAQTVDLTKREEYQAELQEVDELITKLFGPRPGTEEPVLTQLKFGATRWDQTQRIVHRLKYDEQWIQEDPAQPRVQKLIPREEQFAGTRLEGMFDYLEANIEQMMSPKATFYWQYFIDDSTPGHYFGGVGPEIIGTLLLTVISMLFAVPFGVVAAAYLVECAGENIVVRMIRMCINTLAGVPSIVFGLFGLAFFVLFLFPLFRLPSKPCMLAAAMTLGVLTLPVVIRASEEAIRSVPRTYKEASLGLGAGRFRTFIKVTLPAAMPGILTGVILSLSRVAGETAPILFTGAVALGPIPKSLFDPSRTLSYGSYDLAVGDRLAMEVPHNQFGMVVTLILIILLLNTVSIVLRSKMNKKLRGH